MSCTLRHRTQCSLLDFVYKIKLVFPRLEPHASYSYENNMLRHGQKSKKSQTSATLLWVFTSGFPLFNFPLGFISFHIDSISILLSSAFRFSLFPFWIQYNRHILKLLVVRLFAKADTEWGPNKPIRCFCLRCSVIWKGNQTKKYLNLKLGETVSTLITKEYASWQLPRLSRDSK